MRSIVFALTLIFSTGCVVSHGHHHHRGSKRSSVASSKPSNECHPSQRWDGTRCVHKGKGRGARKHDG